MKRIMVVLCTLFLLASQAAFAADFTQNIRMIAPYAPGGAVDVTLRMLAEVAPKYLDGKQLIVENIPGGGGVIGLTAAARAKPDGYTLTVYINTIYSNAVSKKVGFTVDSFIPLVLYANDPTLIVVKADSPFKNLKSFIEHAKKNPVSLNTSANTGTGHIAGIAIQNYFDLKINFIHTNSGGVQITQLLGGHVDGSLIGLGEVGTYLKEGNVRCLGITSEADQSALGFPTMEPFSSVGMVVDGKPFEWGAVRGICAIAGTPEPMVKALEKAFLGMIADPVFVERMTKAGFSVTPLGLKETQAQAKILEKTFRDILPPAEK